MKRELFLDQLKTAATCAVVLLHTVTGVMDHTDMSAYPGQFRLFLILMDLACWSVPVFLMISGYLFLNPARKVTQRDVFSRYARRIMLALLLFGVPYACLEMIATEKTFRFGMLAEGLAMVLRGESWAHLWYLYLILVLYLVTPLLRAVLGVLPVWGVYLLQGILLVCFSVLPFFGRVFGVGSLSAIPAGGIYFFYYICGYLFAVRKSGGTKTAEAFLQNQTENPTTGQTTNRAGKRSSLPMLCALTVGVGMLLSRVSGSYTLQMAYNYPFTVLLAVLLFAGAYSLRRDCDAGTQKNTGIWEKLSAISFTVYLTHPVFLNLYYKMLHLSPLQYPIAISLPLFFLGALLPAAFTAVVLRTIPFLRRNVL